MYAHSSVTLFATHQKLYIFKKQNLNQNSAEYIVVSHLHQQVATGFTSSKVAAGLYQSVSLGSLLQLENSRIDHVCARPWVILSEQL